MTEQAEELETEEVEITEEAQVESPETVETTEEAAEQKQSKSQNAKQRLRRKLSESNAVNEELRKTNTELLEKFSALEQKVESVVNPPAARPERVNFETEEEYEDALYDWRTPEAVEQPVSSDPKPDSDPVDPISTEARENWHDQIDAASDKYEDFDDVISNKDLVMTDAMAIAVMESPQGGEVAYFLGKNPAEAERISKLSATAQVREIDKIETKFQSTTSSAPEPIQPTKGGDSPVKDVSKMSMAEYAAHRNSQGA